MSLFKRYLRLEVGMRSSALAFSTILAIIPILGILLRYLQRAGITQDWIDQLKGFVLSHLNLGRGDAVIGTIDQLVSKVGTKTWGWVGVTILVYASWNLITRFSGTLDHILKVKSAEETPLTLGFIKLTLRRAFVCLALPLVLLASIATQQWIQEDSWFKTLLSIESVAPFVLLPLSWSVNVVGLYLVYYLVPRRPVQRLSVLKAATVATIGLESTRYLLSSYNQYAITTENLYGIFAVVPLTLLWIQISWMIILFGALLLKERRA